MSTGRPQREVAHRLFAVEFDHATVSLSESDEEMAPSYVLTPAGALVNRAFVVGAVTSVDQVGDDIYRARISDPTGTFVCYAGQYQPEAANMLAEFEPPGFVAMTGKARTFTPEGSSDVLSSLRPERIADSDVDARNRWVVEAATQTLARIEWFARAGAGPADDVAARLQSMGLTPGLARGIEHAIREYDTSATYLSALRTRAIEALEVVFDDRESVTPFELAPDAADGSVTMDELATDAFFEMFRTGEPTADSVTATPRGADAIDEATDASPDDPPVDDPTPAPEESNDPPEASPASQPTGAEATTEDEGMDADRPDPPDPPKPPAEDAPPAESTDEPSFELSQAEREEIEDEYGTEFSTGDDVDDGDADTQPESPDPAPATPDAPNGAEDVDDDDGDDEDDLQETVLSHMMDLDEGDGADREALIDAVVDETGLARDRVDDAVQDALMSGTCYEPQEGRLKPI